ncbi:universal stress protein, partial [Halococcus hamelinensis]
AKTYDSALHVIHVVDLHPPYTEVDLERLYAAFEKAGQEAIDEAVDQAEAAGVCSIEATILEGSPAIAILEYADKHDIDLIVMGTHGRRGIRRYLIGSVAERVVRLASVPVLTVRMSNDPPSIDP